MHFIFLQIAALIAALLAKAWILVPAPPFFIEVNQYLRPAFWGFGFWLFVYSLYAAAAAVMAIFVMVRAFDGQKSRELRNRGE